jgi:hypothetical protein
MGRVHQLTGTLSPDVTPMDTLKGGYDENEVPMALINVKQI